MKNGSKFFKKIKEKIQDNGLEISAAVFVIVFSGLFIWGLNKAIARADKEREAEAAKQKQETIAQETVHETARETAQESRKKTQLRNRQLKLTHFMLQVSSTDTGL